MEEEKTKSQLKREAEALQKLGVSLIDWSIEKLDKLPLPAHVKQAIIAAKSLRSHGAIRRQAQLIGKLMRTSDLEDFYPIYESMVSDDNAQTASFHEVEYWRMRFITEGNDALTEFVDKFHPNDLQSLKQHIKKAIDEHTKGQPKGAGRALFRYLRSYIQ
jgi:ribosome-associated protein